MESQPQNPEFRNNPEKFHPCVEFCLNHFYLEVYEGCLSQDKNDSETTVHNLLLRQPYTICCSHQLGLEVERPEWSTIFSFFGYFTR